MRVPMSEPDITAAERAAVDEVLSTPTLSIGPQLAQFERRMADRVGTRHAAGVSSGTAGLHLAMIAAGVEPDDVVITTPFSFVASANCVLYQGARPVFADIDPVTLTIDPERVAEAFDALVGRLGRRGRVRAILPVHVFGQPADMDPICGLARAHDIAVVEDACEALGAEYKGRAVGTLGDAAVFGFYPNKQLTTGEGGMIATDHADWDALFRSLRNQGRDVFDGWLMHSRLGYNYRLDEMSAALGAAQLTRLDELLARRARVAGWYTERLADVDGITVPSRAPWTTRTSWFVYVVRLVDAEHRDPVIRALAARGVPARPYFPTIHLQPVYRSRFGFQPGDFPVAEAAAATCLALPFFGTMTETQVDEVCELLSDTLAEVRGDGLPAARGVA